MTTAIWSLVAYVFPLVLALAICVGPLRRPALAIGWTAALPALAVAIGAGGGEPFEIGLLLLGVRADGPDGLTRALLLPTALLWLVAGSFARTYLVGSEHRRSFWFYFLVTCSGNLGALLARDVATFYVAYAVMTFAAYGLILHDRSEEARRAGRVYITMALAADMALLAALWMIVGDRVNLPIAEAPLAALRSAHPDLALGLLLVGFGVKAGVLPLHMWLPLAHPVAPAPASAILSGALIKAGLFGWIRFLPLGLAAHPSSGAALIVIGVVTIAYAAVVGSFQREPKTVLAYSSISQMGYMLVPLGVGLAVPAVAKAAVLAAVLFAQQHALAKGALFLGTAVASDASERRPRRLVTAGLLVSALAIAGAPFTSGALAKLAVKDVSSVMPSAGWIGAALAIGSIGSTLLMARFLAGVLTAPAEPASAAPARGLWGPWAVLVAAGVAQPVYAWTRGASAGSLFEPGAVWSASWPIVIGAALALSALVAFRRGAVLPAVPAGDLLVPIESAARHARTALSLSLEPARDAWKRLAERSSTSLHIAARRTWRPEASEALLRRFSTIGCAVLLLALASVITTRCSASRTDGASKASVR